MERNNIISSIIIHELSENVVNEVVTRISIELGETSVYRPEPRRNVARNEDYYEATIPLYTADLFKEHFRMSCTVFQELVTIIGNNNSLPPRMVVPLEKRLLFTIWVLSKPESFVAVEDRFGLARSTAHYIFKETVAIIKNLMGQFIKWPNSHAETIEVFRAKSNGFPGVVGVVDGCHIPIKQPLNNSHDYYNRKQFHSIILQGICDHRLVFTDVYIGLPGRMHDARVLRHSTIYGDLTALLPEDCHILRDSAYPLMQNILTPYKDNGYLSPAQINYNVKLSNIRSSIERTFGRLKEKFRRLKYLDIADPDFGVDIIAAACVLHNIIILMDSDGDDCEEYEVDSNKEIPGENFEIEEGRGAEKRITITNLLY